MPEEPQVEVPQIQAAQVQARQIVQQRRRRRRASIAAAVVAVGAIGATAAWAAQLDDERASITVRPVDPTQVGNPPGPQTGPAAPASAFADAGQVTPGGPAIADFTLVQPIVRTGYNDRQLVVSIIGGEPRLGDDDPNPCGVDYVGSARLDGDRFVVRLDRVGPTSRPTTVVCSLVGYTRTAVINLPEPLDGRSVVDEAGTPIRVLDASDFLIPRVVPRGWAAQFEGANADAHLPAQGFRWIQGYAETDPAGRTASTNARLRLEEVESAGATVDVATGLQVRPGPTPDAPLDGRVLDNQDAPMTPVERVTVRGHEALVFDYLGDLHTITIIWQEGTRVHAITADSSSTSGLTTSDLVAMAQSMTTATGR